MSWDPPFLIVIAGLADPFLAFVVRPGWALGRDPRARGSQGTWVATTFTSTRAAFLR